VNERPEHLSDLLSLRKPGAGKTEPGRGATKPDSIKGARPKSSHQQGSGGQRQTTQHGRQQERGSEPARWVQVHWGVSMTTVGTGSGGIRLVAIFSWSGINCPIIVHPSC